MATCAEQIKLLTLRRGLWKAFWGQQISMRVTTVFHQPLSYRGPVPNPLVFAEPPWSRSRFGVELGKRERRIGEVGHRFFAIEKIRRLQTSGEKQSAKLKTEACEQSHPPFLPVSRSLLAKRKTLAMAGAVQADANGLCRQSLARDDLSYFPCTKQESRNRGPRPKPTRSSMG